MVNIVICLWKLCLQWKYNFKFQAMFYLDNYFDLHFCLRFHLSLLPLVHASIILSVTCQNFITWIALDHKLSKTKVVAYVPWLKALTEVFVPQASLEGLYKYPQIGYLLVSTKTKQKVSNIQSLMLSLTYPSTYM